MHASSVRNMRKFFSTYSKPGDSVLDVGSQVIMENDPKYKEIAIKHNCKYEGLDIQAGRNVDIIVSSPYKWTKIKSHHYDIVISGQSFEHIQFFWLTFMEMVRVLKPNGCLCIIAPSEGYYHNMPVDCWRFLKDSMKALEIWSHTVCLFPTNLIETYIDLTSEWKDCVGVFKKYGRSVCRNTQG